MAQLAAVVADAEARGVVEASQCASTAAWVAEYGWHVRRDAYTIAKAAKLLRRPDLTDVADSVLTVDVDLGRRWWWRASSTSWPRTFRTRPSR